MPIIFSFLNVFRIVQDYELQVLETETSYSTNKNGHSSGFQYSAP